MLDPPHQIPIVAASLSPPPSGDQHLIPSKITPDLHHFIQDYIEVETLQCFHERTTSVDVEVMLGELIGLGLSWWLPFNPNLLLVGERIKETDNQAILRYSSYLHQCRFVPR